MIERIILIGFMYSGKTTVGRALAERLGWDFVDLDEAIERRTGATIADIFREQGESAFRRLEAEFTRELAARRHLVIAPGGGWVTQPELPELLRRDGLMITLRVSPETVYARHREAGGPERPLLDVEDPLATIRELLERRAPAYEQADAVLDVDTREPAEIVAIIERLLQVRQGPDQDAG